VARREDSGIVSSMPKKHIGKGTILILRVTAVAGEMERNKGYRDKEGKRYHCHDNETDRNVSSSHTRNDWLGWISAYS
jgi:hypothetical protein